MASLKLIFLAALCGAVPTAHGAEAAAALTTVVPAKAAQQLASLAERYYEEQAKF